MENFSSYWLKQHLKFILYNKYFSGYLYSNGTFIYFENNYAMFIPTLV
jgi:hypothetical protein